MLPLSPLTQEGNAASTSHSLTAAIKVSCKVIWAGIDVVGVAQCRAGLKLSNPTRAMKEEHVAESKQ